MGKKNKNFPRTNSNASSQNIIHTIIIPHTNTSSGPPVGQNRKPTKRALINMPSLPSRRFPHFYTRSAGNLLPCSLHGTRAERNVSIDRKKTAAEGCDFNRRGKARGQLNKHNAVKVNCAIERRTTKGKTFTERFVQKLTCASTTPGKFVINKQQMELFFK